MDVVIVGEKDGDGSMRRRQKSQVGVDIRHFMKKGRAHRVTNANTHNEANKKPSRVGIVQMDK